ncbi:uncharacterized protein A1O9_08664 [Exophiala aquamarina CBS 119918]|uniref:Exonuclease domain-containing protein n=1 Tax=Exophiala aquamarina CBS 119918 TaxID=1182545 RepID=A0A072P567_9EURO|nr:uncharacterized protein A1O9_08664 [Exophiala aquamarina CBS 119918]KEF55011.1 hypothetical protein A1O9_08664 [Exophiala aquamarina CBS 119918]
MFSALGLFKNTPCPRLEDCSLPNCIFSHLVPEDEDAAGTTQEYDPFSAGQISPQSSPPAPKRRRIASPGRQVEPKYAPHAVPNDGAALQKPSQHPTSPNDGIKGSSRSDVYPSRKSLSTVSAQQSKVTPSSAKREVSPPPTKRSRPSLPPVKKEFKIESLTPRNVAKAPAMLKTRLAVLQAVHKQVQDQNRKLAVADNKWKAFVLDDQELIRFSLDEEEAATKLGDSIYRNAMAQKVLRIKKMTTEEWVKMVKTWSGVDPEQDQNTPAANKNGSPAPSARQLSMSEEITLLQRLRTPLEGLENYGYVTKEPTASEITAAEVAVASAAGFEKCDRCGTRFQVFPGRDEQGRLTSHGTCRYHWARANRAASSKSDKIVGRSEASFPCCNQLEGSEGCTEASTHVFNVKHPPRLASILQFMRTPQSDVESPGIPLSFDCEMGYTTLGMEVIRLTAVTWPEGRVVVDVLVRPFGEILDLNTRFSGVTREAYANAVEYEPGTELQPGDIRKVGSPAVARQLLFDRLSPDTPLLGHAIENDLNVCRIIHPFVVDTVLLYPHPRGLPIRFSLKVLAQKYLSRGIQTGGEAGHDSSEDAIATGDLVRQKTRDLWTTLLHEGWKFVGGALKGPGGFEADARTPPVL